MSRYIVASSNPIYRSMFERLSRPAHDWFWVSSPKELSLERVRNVNPRYIFFPHWSVLVPREVFERWECVIFHMTDVPFGRGGSPLQNLIVRGFAETKISAIRCVAEIDAGPVYMKRPLSLLGSAEEIFVRAADVIEEMILEMVSNEPEPVPQQGEPVYFERRRPEQGALDLFPTLTQAFDAIRMLDAPGYPPAFADVGPFRLELTKAHRDEDFIEAKVRILMRKPRESES